MVTQAKPCVPTKRIDMVRTNQHTGDYDVIDVQKVHVILHVATVKKANGVTDIMLVDVWLIVMMIYIVIQQRNSYCRREGCTHARREHIC